MKLKLALTATAAVAVAAAIAIVPFSHRHLTPSAPQARTFQVHGHVRGLNPTEKTIRIAHDDIPDYMPAMTMSLPVKEPTLLNNLAADDEVQFELTVTSDDSWISHIEKIPSAAVNSLPGTRPGRSPEELEAECLRTGEMVPDFQFTDQEGGVTHLKDFRGKAVLLTFIYTRCPLPNFCPLMSKNFAELEQRLRKEFPNKVRLLSISIDPEFDRPEVLKNYAARYGADPKDWSFAAMDSDTLTSVAATMGLYFEKQNGLISHDLRTALIGPDGRLVQLWKSNVWTPYELQRSVRETLTGHPDLASR
jgi:protein SCO1/2